MNRRQKWAGRLMLFLLCLACMAATAQQQQQDIPDAPSATRPPQSFPSAPPPARPEARAPDQVPPAKHPEESAPQETPAAPMPQVTTAPQGGETREPGSPRDQLYTLKTNVNFVLVPVTVKDDTGRLVAGLLPNNFTVLENNAKQKLTFFTSDPFPLSAAVIFDLGMPDAAVQKVNQTFPALEGAFSQFDEVSIYTYSGTVSQVADFSAVNQKVVEVLKELKTKRGRNNGPPVVSGPLGPQGPIVNGRPVDPRVPTVATPPRESRVLNDAMLQAALDLSKRDRARRKIIFIISDGREYGSDASYSDVLKVLLSNEIQVYAVAVEGAAIPLYGKLQKLKLPRFGTGDILPKYANATGGWVFTEFSRPAIESIYARAISDARNQYTLGYNTRAVPSSAYRQIDVRVDRPDCEKYADPTCVRVYAKDGYYPVPPVR